MSLDRAVGSVVIALFAAVAGYMVGSVGVPMVAIEMGSVGLIPSGVALDVVGSSTALGLVGAVVAGGGVFFG